MRDRVVRAGRRVAPVEPARMLLIASPAEATKRTPRSFSENLKEAGKRALGGGLPGAAAMAIQVGSLMWIRTAMNFQYRHGMSTTEAFKHLWKEGGIPRFYRGLLPALAQAPLSRFGDTAANSGALALLESYEATENLPTFVKTMFASLSAGAFRIFLMPIDALKTIMQVEGKKGLPMLGSKIRANGPFVLWHGALGAATATFVGHYPWFFVYNSLNAYLPRYQETWKKHVRSAAIGFSASAVSDTISNSLRVVKTYRQTAAEPVSYFEAARRVVDKEGYMGLLGRGLKTRLLANGLQGMMFTVLWRAFEEKFFPQTERKDRSAVATDKSNNGGAKQAM